MPLSSVACVGLSPHVDTCQTSHHDSAKKKRSSHSLKQTQNTFMFLASLVQCMHFRRFKKNHVSNYHPQLCAHGAFKIIKQHVTEFVPFTHSASHHPSTPPPVVLTGRFQGPWPSLLTAPTAAPAATSCSTVAVWPLRAAPCSGVRPQAPKGSETSMAGRAPPRGSPPPTPTLDWERLESVEWSPWVSSFQNCIASWLNDLNGSHYRCWCLWRSLRLRTDGTFHNRKSEKSEKGKTVFLRLRKLVSTYLKHFQALFHTHTVGPYG